MLASVDVIASVFLAPTQGNHKTEITNSKKYPNDSSSSFLCTSKIKQ